MIIKNRLGMWVIALIAATSVISMSPQAYAAVPIECPDGYQTTSPTGSDFKERCSNHQTGGPQADEQEAESGNSGTSSNFEGDCKGSLDAKDCGISAYILLFTNALSALVGIVIVIMTVIGGIQYSAARDNPQAVQAAKGKIINAMLALFIYLFMFAFLQYLVPGGIL